MMKKIREKKHLCGIVIRLKSSVERGGREIETTEKSPEDEFNKYSKLEETDVDRLETFRDRVLHLVDGTGKEEEPRVLVSYNQDRELVADKENSPIDSIFSQFACTGGKRCRNSTISVSSHSSFQKTDGAREEANIRSYFSSQTNSLLPQTEVVGSQMVSQSKKSILQKDHKGAVDAEGEVLKDEVEAELKQNQKILTSRNVSPYFCSKFVENAYTLLTPTQNSHRVTVHAPALTSAQKRDESYITRNADNA